MTFTLYKNVLFFFKSKTFRKLITSFYNYSIHKFRFFSFLFFQIYSLAILYVDSIVLRQYGVHCTQCADQY